MTSNTGICYCSILDFAMLINLPTFYTVLGYTIPITFLLVLVEFLYSYHKKDGIYSTNGTISHTANAVIYELLLSNSIFIMFTWVLTVANSYFHFYEVQTVYSVWEFIFCLLAADFSFYIYHVFHHKLSFLWMFHFVHHSDDKLNLATSYRFSIIEKFYSPIMFVFPILLGFNPYLVIFCFYLMSVYQFINHSQYLKLPKFLEYIFITPNLHSIHHDNVVQNKNFGSMFSIWDRLFGTYEKKIEKLHPGIAGYKQEDFFKMQFDPIKNYFKKFR